MWVCRGKPAYLELGWDGHPFVVDLSELQFLDVRGARALVAGTYPYRRNGGRVVLLVPPRVDRLVRLLGLDREPGILTEALG